MRYALPLLLIGSPAFAATGPFFSLGNTDFIVTLGFLLFLGILVYFRVPSRLTGMLDDRSGGIRSDLDEARALREEAQALLASYERKTREARAQADQIVANAKAEAQSAAEQAKLDLKTSVDRRLAGAEGQIESARNAAIREVRDRAIQIATSVAAEMVARQMTAKDADRMIDQSIETVSAKLH
ncbi:F0F1 ATP synthase subunit B [uncultured Jannaschia sp.]|uniref:F0F1 ATP synthase subunit B n=1 Tax=uncultured Jannaschia sp. TaxID=293347 RepID=UPI00262478FC|nr:F0F1 ATP synthase subunit B [uncultured Jannaschia sp.]